MNCTTPTAMAASQLIMSVITSLPDATRSPSGSSKPRYGLPDAPLSCPLDSALYLETGVPSLYILSVD